MGTKKQSTKNKKTNSKSLKKNPLKYIVIAIMVIILFLFSLIGEQYIWWPVTYVMCGGKTPIATSSFAGGKTYYLPGQYTAGGLFLMDGYSCDEHALQKAGYSKASVSL